MEEIYKMIYYQIGIVDYMPRLLYTTNTISDYTDSYILGEAIPIIISFNEYKNYKKKQIIVKDIIYWFENTIEDLKPGDAIIVNIYTNEMYRIKTVARGVIIER